MEWHGYDRTVGVDGLPLDPLIQSIAREKRGGGGHWKISHDRQFPTAVALQIIVCQHLGLVRRTFLRHCSRKNRRYPRATTNSLRLTVNISTPMPDELGQPKLGKHGGPRIKGQQSAGSTLKRGSTSVDYILARLEREGLTDWIEAIRMRRISAFAVAVELGWAKRPQTLHGENCNQAKRRAFDIRRLIQRL